MKKLLLVILLLAPTTYTFSSFEYKTSLASWYGKPFHGRKTASGEVYNMYDLTCAHKTLPLGTKLKVTNVKNNKSVILRVTDRGPFIKGRDLDLSYKAAQALGYGNTGVAKVTYKVIN